MEETLISFEAAKLAKEVGFDWKCYSYYDNNGKLYDNYLENGSSTDTDFRVDLKDLLENWNQKNMQVAIANFHNFKPTYSYVYSAPTQSLLQKFLRDVHKIHIEISLGHDENNIWYNFNLFKIEFGYKYDPINLEKEFSGSNSYEEALEIGLQESLKLIKDGK